MNGGFDTIDRKYWKSFVLMSTSGRDGKTGDAQILFLRRFQGESTLEEGSPI